MKLSELPTKGKNNCKVTVDIYNFTITREYPTNITILKEGSEIEYETNRQKQDYINKIFGDVDFFRKFRILDINQGINILEEGRSSLRKTLFAIHDYIFNNIRKNLQEKKREREIYNRDNLSTYSHYPSLKRKKLLESKLLEIAESIYELDKEVNSMERDYYNLVSSKAGLEKEININKNNKNRIFGYSECPTCKRKMNRQTKINLTSDINGFLKKLYDRIKDVISDIDDQKDILAYLKENKQNLNNRKSKLNELKLKLNSRLQQREYKYSQKDIEIMKQAIKELDNFSAFYITEWIKILEPIINDIISCIGFSVNFSLDEKGRIDLIITKDDKEFTYKSLSSGQRLILYIAFNLAILMEKNRSGIVIADEGASVLDSDNMNYLFGIFKQSPFQLSIVVHRLDEIPAGIDTIKL
jgi:hypothetical protein